MKGLMQKKELQAIVPISQRDCSRSIARRSIVNPYSEQLKVIATKKEQIMAYYRVAI